MAEEVPNLLNDIVHELHELRKSTVASAEEIKNVTETNADQAQKNVEAAIKSQENLLPEHLRNALKENRNSEEAAAKKAKGPRKIKDDEKNDPLSFLKGSFNSLFEKLDTLKGGDSKEEKSGSSFFAKLLGPGAMLLISGLAALVASFAGFGGQFSGLLQGFGKWGTTGGIKMIGGTFVKMVGKLGKFFAKFLRRIPIVGGLISFGFAYQAFKQGDYLGGVLDIASGILNLLPFGFTQVMSFGIDMFNAWLDYKNAPDESGKKPGKLNIVKEMCAPIWDFIKPYAHNIPILGTFLYATEAYGAFKAGEIGKGIWKMTGAFSSLIPTLGPLLHQGASALLGFTDGDFDKAKEGKPSKGIQMGTMLKDWAVGRIAKTWKKMPWWVQKPLRSAMPASVIKWLDAGDKPPPEPKDDESYGRGEPTGKKTIENQDQTKGKVRLNKSDTDLRQMTSNDLRNLRDEHGANWNTADYQRIQKELDERTSGKTYTQKNRKTEDDKELSKKDQFLKTTLDGLKSVGNEGGDRTSLDLGGSGEEDDIPALLKGGEFVSTKETVKTLGSKFFEDQNRNTLKSESTTNSAQLARDKVTKDILLEIKATNELQKASMLQQHKLSQIHAENLEITKRLLDKNVSSNVTAVNTSNVNITGGGSVRNMREQSALSPRR